jgi:hypothetical protein
MKYSLIALCTFVLVALLIAAYFVGRRTGFADGYRTAEEHWGVANQLGTWDASDLVIPLRDAK